MKKQIHPAFMTILLGCTLVVAGYFLFHAATDKPYYPGWNVAPGGGPGMTKEQGEALSKSGAFPKGHVLGSEDPQEMEKIQAKLKSGAAPSMGTPKATEAPKKQ